MTYIIQVPYGFVCGSFYSSSLTKTTKLQGQDLDPRLWFQSLGCTMEDEWMNLISSKGQILAEMCELLCQETTNICLPVTFQVLNVECLSQKKVIKRW